MKPKTIMVLGLIIATIGVIWNISHSQTAKAGPTNTAKGGIASQTAQATDHSTATVTNKIDIHLFTFTSEKSKPLVAEAKAQNPVASLNKPKVAIVNPSVTFINYTDDVQKGLVKAGFNIPFVNIGGVAAKNLTTKWIIMDNGSHITGLDEWRTKFLHQENLVIQDLLPNMAVNLFYSPDIGATGSGTLELTLDYEYMDALTGQKYTGQYKGLVDYRTEKNNQPKQLLLTPR